MQLKKFSIIIKKNLDNNSIAFTINQQTLVNNEFNVYFNALVDNLKTTNGSFLNIEYSNNQLTITNDYLGAFPVYYYEDLNKIIITNSYSFIINQIIPKVCSKKLTEYFIGNFLDQKLTLYSEVYRLPEGSELKYINNKLTIKSSNDLRKKAYQQKTNSNFPDEFKAILKSVLSEYNIEAGYQLSGGVDSSAIVSLAAERHISTYSIVFPDSEMDESLYQNEFLHKNINLNQIQSKSFILKDYKNIASQIQYFPDYPNSIQLLPILELLETQKNNFIVTGFGGDQLFAKLIPVHNSFSQLIPAKYKLWFNRRHFPWVKKKIESEYFDRVLQKKTFHKLNKYQNNILQQIYSPNTLEYLISAQQIASEYNITKLHPLLDQRIIEYCLEISEDNWIQYHLDKKLLKESVKDLLPPKIFNRNSKVDFSKLFTNTVYSEEFKQIFYSGLDRYREYLEVDFLIKNYERDLQHQRTKYSYLYWNIIGLEIFSRNF